VKPVAVDTNVLVRVASGDSPGEHRRALGSLARNRWRILTTVLLETEWVLRSRYGYSTAQFASFVEWLDGNDHVEISDAKFVRAALRHHRDGLDFADALHVAQATDHPFMTLDRKLLRHSRRLGLDVVPVEP
jgi:predicted nucleic acid-binding protein